MPSLAYLVPTQMRSMGMGYRHGMDDIDRHGHGAWA